MPVAIRAYPSADGLSLLVTERAGGDRERLADTSETLRSVLETSPVGIIVRTADGDLLRVNRRAQEILGMSEDELASAVQEDARLDAIHPNGSPVEEGEYPTDLARQRGEPVHDRRIGILEDGGTRWLSVSAAPLSDREGEVDRLITVFDDVTDRVRHERELARQNERLEEFASVVSHDLRNPLSVAMGHLELAREGEAALDRVAAAHERMEALIDDVLALARKGRAVRETETVSLSVAADSAWSTTDTTRGSLSVDSDLQFEADPDRLRTLLENLFRNAVEHGTTNTGSQPPEDAVEHGSTDTPEDTTGGGGVTVRVGRLEDEPGFYVADDGRGIPLKDRERVFERGHSTGGGTGFGLAIVREIAEAHGWTVDLTESAAGGARFEVGGVEVDG